jgi:hypothetical protein
MEKNKQNTLSVSKSLAGNIRGETLCYVPHIYTNLPTNQGSQQTPQCPMRLRHTGSYTWASLDNEGASESTSYCITKPAKGMGLETLAMDWLHAGWQKTTATGETMESLRPTAVHKGAFY